MIHQRHGVRRWSEVWVAPAAVLVLLRDAAAQSVYPNLHNPSESCFEYLLGAAICALAGGLFHAWLQKGGSGPKDKGRP